MIHLDTHVVIWLYEGERGRIPTNARQRMRDEDLVISPMVELELTYLHEIGRARTVSDLPVRELRRRLGLQISPTSFERVVDHARALTWTRDAFDRLIVANALADGADLLTADRRIRDHLPTAVWH